jgi:tetratricopeptide (TPR) repeat protein
MNKRYSGMCLLFAICAIAQPSLALAEKDCANPRKAAGTMTEPFYRGVEDANNLMSKSKFDEAISRLTKMTEAGTEYEKAIAYYNLGFAYNSKNDLGNAAKAFKKALDLNALPQSQYDQLLYNTGQLYIINKQYDEGIRLLEQFINESCGTVSPEAHVFLASAYVERKKFREALGQIDQAIAKGKPKESWLQLKLAINYELKNYKACAETLVQLIGMVPVKADYWKQLSSVFFEMKNDAESVAVLALAERQGFIEKPGEIKNLYNIYMLMEIPYKAGVLLQDAIDKGKVPGDESNLNSVANAWINAKEADRAEASLKKLAAMSSKGEYDYKLGATYGDNERWKESREALERALQKGGLAKPGDAWMRIAVAAHNLKDQKATVNALQKAMNYDESRRQAGEWMRFVNDVPQPTAAAEAATEATP